MRRAKPLSEVWIHFERQKIDNKYMAKCKYCQTEYYTNVPRMWKHLLKCANCPGTVKETVKHVYMLLSCYVCPAKDNPKAFFAHVNSRKPVKNTIGPLKDRTGSIISTDEGMANIFNEYFASVYTEEDTSEIPIVPIVYRGNNPLTLYRREPI